MGNTTPSSGIESTEPSNKAVSSDISASVAFLTKGRAKQAAASAQFCWSYAVTLLPRN